MSQAPPLKDDIYGHLLPFEAEEDGSLQRRDAIRVPRRIEVDPENLRNGLGQLVLTLVKLLHELLEKQAIRRMEANNLSEAQLEKLGLTLLRQSEELDRLRIAFGLEEADLNLDLGPLGKLL